LKNNLQGQKNCAFGNVTMRNNSIGINNCAFGYDAARGIYDVGSGNTAIGASTMNSDLKGSNNTTLGFSANINTASDVAITNATAIGANSISNASNKIRFGNASVSVIEGQVAYTIASDIKFKKDIKQNVPGLAFINKLNPVTYTFDNREYNKFINGKEEGVEENLTQRTGFIAQEVHQAAKQVDFDFDGIVQPEINGGHYSLAYSSFVVPLVKAVQEQQGMIRQLQNENKEMNKTILKLESLLNKK
jgi:hypothetical protein